MSKRKLISYKEAVEQVLRFTEEGDENLENKDDLEKLFPEYKYTFSFNQVKLNSNISYFLERILYSFIYIYLYICISLYIYICI